MPPLKDLTGQQFGKWTVLHRHPCDKTFVWWWVRCACGLEKAVPGCNLNNGYSRSCRSCSNTHPKTQEMRRMREAGYRVKYIAKRLQCHPGTVSAWAGPARRWSWMVTGFLKVRRLRRKGVGWLKIQQELKFPYRSLHMMQRAYTREHVFRAKKRYRKAYAIWRYTRDGVSAARLGELFGVSERSIVRYRRLVPPILDRDRIAKLQARGVLWRDISARLGSPLPDWRDLQAWYEAITEFELDRLLGQQNVA